MTGLLRYNDGILRDNYGFSFRTYKYESNFPKIHGKTSKVYFKRARKIRVKWFFHGTTSFDSSSGIQKEKLSNIRF